MGFFINQNHILETGYSFNNFYINIRDIKLNIVDFVNNDGSINRIYPLTFQYFYYMSKDYINEKKYLYNKTLTFNVPTNEIADVNLAYCYDLLKSLVFNGIICVDD